MSVFVEKFIIGKETNLTVAVKDNIGSTTVMKKIGMDFVKSYFHKDPLGDLDAVLYRMPIN